MFQTTNQHGVWKLGGSQPCRSCYRRVYVTNMGIYFLGRWVSDWSTNFWASPVAQWQVGYPTISRAAEWPEKNGGCSAGNEPWGPGSSVLVKKWCRRCELSTWAMNRVVWLVVGELRYLVGLWTNPEWTGHRFQSVFDGKTTGYFQWLTWIEVWKDL